MRIVGVLIFVFVHLASATTKEVEDCEDEVVYCDSIKALCHDKESAETMFSLCKKTCSMCAKPEPKPIENEEEACVDKNLNCHNVFSNCKTNDTEFQDILREKCARTCGFCKSPKEGTAGCVDKFSGCSKVELAYCQSSNRDLKSLLI
ncbi:hypothetical protein M3Y97_01102500 [Aphelenchoides bicaudatus]|nr:hypothetical protein M3Y97_01102500 [Aphelenchoides bicaudatus]